MTTAVMEQPTTAQALGLERSRLAHIAEQFEAEAGLASTADLAAALGAVEHLARVVEYLQVVGAAAADQQEIARVGETRQGLGWSGPPAIPGDSREFRDTAEYLRARLGITRLEAQRRIRLGRAVLPRRTATGEPCPPLLEILGDVFRAAAISSYAATRISDAVERVRPCASTVQVQAMEENLAAQATESDADLLNVVIRRWEAALDPDGVEPTEELLKAQQGVFLRGRRRGLHRLEIAADDEQFEYLLTVMNTASNPRTLRNSSGSGGDDHSAEAANADGDGSGDSRGIGGTGPDWERRTRPQRHLDGLVGACQVALATDTLPATGGHRPQVMITIDYGALAEELRDTGSGGFVASPADPHPHPGGGYSIFGGPVTARTVRKIACDADIIPVVLGGGGEVLDVGRARRLFGVAQRRALVARDRGCAFPNCTVPAVWTEAHHITPWVAGGRTDVSNGCLLCCFHHRLVERGNWVIEMRRGIPWFTPPPYIDPGRTPRRNRHRELTLDGTP